MLYINQTKYRKLCITRNLAGSVYTEFIYMKNHKLQSQVITNGTSTHDRDNYATMIMDEATICSVNFSWSCTMLVDN